MPHLEPGETFEIEYGSGHKLGVIALSFRQKREVIRGLGKVKQLQATGDSITELYDIMEAMLRTCSPAITDEQLDTLDEQLAMEVVSKTLKGARLSDDESKKSE